MSKRDLSPDASSASSGKRRLSSLTHLRIPSHSCPSGPRDPSTPIKDSASLENLKSFKSSSMDFQRVIVTDTKNAHQLGDNLVPVCKMIQEALALRRRMVWFPDEKGVQSEAKTDAAFEHPTADIPPATGHTFESIAGVFKVKAGPEDEADPLRVADEYVPTWEEFFKALKQVMKAVTNGALKSLAHKRLSILEARFDLHQLLNSDMEAQQQKSVPHRDFYNVRKVDNHVHHSACMNQKHMLRFIKHKLKNAPDMEVIKRDGKTMTLRQVFESLNLSPHDLNVDMLDMHAKNAFHRFDRFNLKYNPIGESRLREIFLKYANHSKGLFLAEITQQVFDDLETNKYQSAEYRLSIYGRNAGEWDKLAAWVVDNKLFSAHCRWMIQIPRLYKIYRRAGMLQNFGQMIDNIFRPLFEVSVDPSMHPKLHMFLQQVVGIDSVDDESQRETPAMAFPAPADWTSDDDPPYSYFSYYVYANLKALSILRYKKGFSTFRYRPHAGEAGDFDHLATTFLTAHSINHGIVLKQHPGMQYLYYLAQIGMSLSPLSNNLLFVEYDKNPFPAFFARGLNVTLSTDDPLMIHVTKEPLVEEYSVAAQVWKLTGCDMCEIGRNSVLQSGFEHGVKLHWLGDGYWKRSTRGNSTKQTNVPDIRIQYRLESLTGEFKMLQRHWSQAGTAETDTDFMKYVDPL